MLIAHITFKVILYVTREVNFFTSLYWPFQQKILMCGSIPIHLNPWNSTKRSIFIALNRFLLFDAIALAQSQCYNVTMTQIIVFLDCLPALVISGISIFIIIFIWIANALIVPNWDSITSLGTLLSFLFELLLLYASFYSLTLLL